MDYQISTRLVSVMCLCRCWLLRVHLKPLLIFEVVSMTLMTMIARVIDGLLLAASMDDDQVRLRALLSLLISLQDRELNEYKSQAKKIFKQLTASSPSRCSIDTHGENIFQSEFITFAPFLLISYIIEHGVCFLTLSEHTFSKAHAFAYLEDLSREFHVCMYHHICVYCPGEAWLRDQYCGPALRFHWLWCVCMCLRVDVCVDMCVCVSACFDAADSTIQKLRKSFLDNRNKQPSNLVVILTAPNHNLRRDPNHSMSCKQSLLLRLLMPHM